MARVVKVTLGSHFEEFVQACIASGRYNSVSKVVCACLRLLVRTMEIKSLLRR